MLVANPEGVEASGLLRVVSRPALRNRDQCRLPLFPVNVVRRMLEAGVGLGAGGSQDGEACAQSHG